MWAWTGTHNCCEFQRTALACLEDGAPHLSPSLKLFLLSAESPEPRKVGMSCLDPSCLHSLDSLGLALVLQYQLPTV